ncbi:hypothetical protein KQX54_002003 [Cotesia glomerata]|uniref:Uncharacterized protein n=1 Tax=Cotesia glomerata TaxID=32391 RepID=A0AAV7I4M7_COTGL|nr:hypothetical protein KQX54_002003 [Cotesia glomerata]
MGHNVIRKLGGIDSLCFGKEIPVRRTDRRKPTARLYSERGLPTETSRVFTSAVVSDWSWARSTMWNPFQ